MILTWYIYGVLFVDGNRRIFPLQDQIMEQVSVESVHGPLTVKKHGH